MEQHKFTRTYKYTNIRCPGTLIFSAADASEAIETAKRWRQKNERGRAYLQLLDSQENPVRTGTRWQ